MIFGAGATTEASPFDATGNAEAYYYFPVELRAAA
jgi:hypothetical protein